MNEANWFLLPAELFIIRFICEIFVTYLFFLRLTRFLIKNTFKFKYYSEEERDDLSSKPVLKSTSSQQIY
jgi:hypothetical protein